MPRKEKPLASSDTRGWWEIRNVVDL